MTRELTSLPHIGWVYIDNNKIFIKKFGSADRLAGRTYDFRAAPKIHTILYPHTIDKCDITTEQSCICSMVLAVDRVDLGSAGMNSILDAIETRWASSDRNNKLCPAHRFDIWQ